MAFFNDDEKPAAIPNAVAAGSKQGLVSMTIPKYSKPDVAMTADSVKAVVEIKATPSAAVREGLDLVAVVDVSGSMKGHKMESAKRALQFVIMKLTPADRLSIVVFNGAAERRTPLRSMTQDAQSELKAVVDGLAAGGYTDIKAGLDLGLAILGGRVHTESRTPNIFLMSDGKLEGHTSGDPRDVRPGDVPVYTFGFGKGTDHELLTDIAKNSTGGTYSSVPDGTNLSAPFALLLGGLLTVVAQDVKLTLTPKVNDGDLDTMTVAPGTDYTQTTDAKGVITINFGTIFSGEPRKVLVDFTLKESAEKEAYNATLAVARHSYAGQETPQPAQNILRRRTPSPSEPDGDGVEERAVQAEQVRRQHAASIKDATRVADEATELKDERMLGDARKVLKGAQNRLEDIVPDDEVDNGDRRMVDALRGELHQLIELMRTLADYVARGRPYALATILAHGRQRATGRGDEDVVDSPYVTPRMKKYLEQAKKFEEKPAEQVPSAEEDVKEEKKEDPFAEILGPIASYLETAIQALQGIQMIVAAKRTA